MKVALKLYILNTFICALFVVVFLTYGGVFLSATLEPKDEKKT